MSKAINYMTQWYACSQQDYPFEQYTNIETHLPNIKIDHTDSPLIGYWSRLINAVDVWFTQTESQHLFCRWLTFLLMPFNDWQRLQRPTHYQTEAAQYNQLKTLLLKPLPSKLRQVKNIAWCAQTGFSSAHFKKVLTEYYDCPCEISLSKYYQHSISSPNSHKLGKSVLGNQINANSYSLILNLGPWDYSQFKRHAPYFLSELKTLCHYFMPTLFHLHCYIAIRLKPDDCLSLGHSRLAEQSWLAAPPLQGYLCYKCFL